MPIANVDDYNYLTTTVQVLVFIVQAKGRISVLSKQDSTAAHRVSDNQTEATMSQMPGRFPANRSMASIASGIQERAMEYDSALAELHDAKGELQQIEAMVAEEEALLASARAVFLEASRSRVEVELELHEAQGQVQCYKKSMEALERSKKSIVEQTESVQSRWESHVKNIYARSQADMDRYRGVLERMVDHKEGNSNRRKDKRKELETGATVLVSNQEDALVESAELKRDISEIESSDERENEEVSSLADEIRDILAKVSFSIFETTVAPEQCNSNTLMTPFRLFRLYTFTENQTT